MQVGKLRLANVWHFIYYLKGYSSILVLDQFFFKRMVKIKNLVCNNGFKNLMFKFMLSPI